MNSSFPDLLNIVLFGQRFGAHGENLPFVLQARCADLDKFVPSPSPITSNHLSRFFATNTYISVAQKSLRHPSSRLSFEVLDFESFEISTLHYEVAPHAISVRSLKEADAVEALISPRWDDKEHWGPDSGGYGKADGDPNAYTTGMIGGHHFVLAWMAGAGTRRSGLVAQGCRSSFPRIELALVVGICGGVPRVPGRKEILLGDVIISTGAVHYSYGKQLDNKFITKDTLSEALGTPNMSIRAFLSRIGGIIGLQRLRDQNFACLPEICGREGYEAYNYPGAAQDRLYNGDRRHKHYDLSTCSTCANCGPDGDVCELALKSSCATLGCGDTMYVERQGRLAEILKQQAEIPGALSKPLIHLGSVGSGDTVMKSGKHRDKIALDTEEKLIAFEMKGAGVWEVLPCVIIKGVCDYADSHKSDIWQHYAAATAAACAKAFLEEWATQIPRA